MSDDDKEGAPFNEWFDSETTFPDISSVNTTPHMGVNVSSHMWDHRGPQRRQQLTVWYDNTPHDWAQENEGSSAMDSSLIRAIQRVPCRWKRRDLIKGMTPLKASPRHHFCVTVGGPWVEEEG